MLPSLSVIIPNYNGVDLIPVFFPSVIKAVERYQGQKEILFVDDRSTDDSLTLIDGYRRQCPALEILKRNCNGGFSKTCNTGIRAATGQILFFLNTDVGLSEDFFDHFAGHFDDPNTFAVTTCGYRYGSDEQIDGVKLMKWRRGLLRVTENIVNDKLPNNLADLGPLWSASVQGAYFFADAAKVGELRGFDELLSPFVFEETDMAYRALKRGWRIVYEPKSVAYHQVSQSLGVFKRRRVRLIATRNRLIFTWKNIHSPVLLVSHVLFHMLRLLSLNPTIWRSTFMALKNVRRILAARKREKQQSMVDDRALLKQLDRFHRSLMVR